MDGFIVDLKQSSGFGLIASSLAQHLVEYLALDGNRAAVHYFPEGGIGPGVLRQAVREYPNGHHLCYIEILLGDCSIGKERSAADRGSKLTNISRRVVGQ